jgi:hypothetical protein
MSYLNTSIVAVDACARDLRQIKLIRASLFSSRLGNQEIVIRNISNRGLGAVVKGLPPMAGERITVNLPVDYDANGTVTWVNGKSFGIALDCEISLQVLGDFIVRQNEKATAKAAWEVKRMHRVASQLSIQQSFVRSDKQTDSAAITCR